MADDSPSPDFGDVPEDEEEFECDGYPEHRKVVVLFEDENVCHWECRACGAECFEEK